MKTLDEIQGISYKSGSTIIVKLDYCGDETGPRKTDYKVIIVKDSAYIKIKQCKTYKKARKLFKKYCKKYLAKKL